MAGFDEMMRGSAGMIIYPGAGDGGGGGGGGEGPLTQGGGGAGEEQVRR